MLGPAPLARRPEAKISSVEKNGGNVMVNFNEDHLPMDAAKSSWQAVDRLRRAAFDLCQGLR